MRALWFGCSQLSNTKPMQVTGEKRSHTLLAFIYTGCNKAEIAPCTNLLPLAHFHHHTEVTNQRTDQSHWAASDDTQLPIAQSSLPAG